MRIAEIYRSIQGEGRTTGTPSVFVRASGCNLRCGFCDTRYASWEPEGPEMTVDEIATSVARHALRHVVITGGEPMLFADLVPLTERLAAAGHHITIETAGTCLLPVRCDLMSISPKLSNSSPGEEAGPQWQARHQRARQRPDIVRRLMRDYDYQLKFVIDQPEDVQEVLEYLDLLPPIEPDRVLLMPQGTDPVALAKTTRWLEPICREHGFTLCPRRHIEWFGAGRGT